MNKIYNLLVYYEERKVGTLALTKNNKIAFQYDSQWLKDGFSISPFSLPLKDTVYVSTKPYFHGLFGIFNNSLPDAWGNILLNRTLKNHGMNPDEIGVLERLAIIGNSGMGALTYRPEIKIDTNLQTLDLDQLSKECHQLLTTEYSNDLDTLFKLGGSSGGTHPKILTQINDEEWMIKFPAPTDPSSIGKMEYDYSLCAKSCGIHMSETCLFPSKTCSGFFGTKRFDRCNEKKIHMATAAALLELDFRQPSMDYHELMKLTKIITKNNFDDTLQMFRIACFNVFAHNRDDHTKKFSFIYDERNNQWHLSPAYDLTYSSTYYGEHTTSVDGNGINPGKVELLKVGIQAGIKKDLCQQIIDEIYTKVTTQLKSYL